MDYTDHVLTISIIVFIGLVLAYIAKSFLYASSSKLMKNIGRIDSAQDEVTKSPASGKWSYIELTKITISTKLTAKKYNLDEINRITQYALKQINKSDKVCYNIVEIHRIKKEIDTSDHVIFTVDLYIYDNMNNVGEIVEVVVAETNGTLAMIAVANITPVKDPSISGGFDFKKISEVDMLATRPRQLQDKLAEFVPL